MSATSPVIGLVVEGPSDERTVKDLVGRMLSATVVFRGLDGEPFLRWIAVDREFADAVARKKVPREHGSFGKGPALSEDSRTTRRALRCFEGQMPRPSAVVLMRDSDGKKDERERGLKLGHEYEGHALHFKVLLGVPHTMRECWVLTALGASNTNETEAAKLKKLRTDLGFYPTERSEELDASNGAAKKNPKRVLAEIIGKNNKDREAELWTDADLKKLRKHGVANGLAAFMSEIEAKLLPLLTGG